MPSRQFAPHVPEFLQIDCICVFRRFHAEWYVAALSGLTLKPVFSLRCVRQRKERPRRLKRTRNNARVEPMVAHNCEPEICVTLTHRPREAARIALAVAHG